MSEFEFVSIEKFLTFYNNKPNTKANYKSRLIKFENFLKYVGELNNQNYKKDVYEFTLEFLQRLKTHFDSSGDIDIYDLMDDFYDYLSLKSLFPNLTDKKSKMSHIYTVVELLKKNKKVIPQGLLDANLKKEKAIESDSKEGLDKELIIKILNAANNDRFKLYLTFLAGSGWRAEEPLYLKWKDFLYVFDDHPNSQLRAKDGKQPKVFLKGEYTKTSTDRNRYITQEVASMLKLWRIKRYEDKRTTVKIEGEEKRKHETTNPIKFSWDHHVFSAKTSSKPISTYADFWYMLNKLRNELELNYLDAKGKRKEINLKSLREYGRTQAYNETNDIEFAEYHFGHKTGYKNKGTIKELEQFKQCELKAFTFLDASVMKDLMKEGSKNMAEMEEKLREELSQSNQLIAKLAYNDWLRDYKDKISNKIKHEVQRVLDRKSNPNDYYIGDREITIDIEEQASEFPKWFKENYGKDLDNDQIAKINIKEVTIQVDTLCELDTTPKYIELDKNKIGTQEGFMEFFKKFIEANPQFK